ncbi:hypothetical protein EJI01_27195 [Variovorax sp. MHTC-1]|nr:hypothetical protein EJI01_27195 [Variovorax sp. MHTC-1]
MPPSTASVVPDGGGAGAGAGGGGGGGGDPVTPESATQDFATDGAGSLPKKEVVQVAEPFTTLCTQRLSAP